MLDNENITPVQLKRNFIMFLEGKANIKDFKIVGVPEVDKNSELYQKYKSGKMRENPQPSNPFWEITASKQ